MPFLILLCRVALAVMISMPRRAKFSAGGFQGMIFGH